MMMLGYDVRGGEEGIEEIEIWKKKKSEQVMKAFVALCEHCSHFFGACLLAVASSP